MSNHPNMSYCAYQNTNGALNQVNGLLEELLHAPNGETSLSHDEAGAAASLYEAAQRYIELINEGATDNGEYKLNCDDRLDATQVEDYLKTTAANVKEFIEEMEAEGEAEEAAYEAKQRAEADETYASHDTRGRDGR